MKFMIIAIMMNKKNDSGIMPPRLKLLKFSIPLGRPVMAGPLVIATDRPVNNESAHKVTNIAGMRS